LGIFHVYQRRRGAIPTSPNNSPRFQLTLLAYVFAWSAIKGFYALNGQIRVMSEILRSRDNHGHNNDRFVSIGFGEAEKFSGNAESGALSRSLITTHALGRIAKGGITGLSQS
jgi:hypothetical protein